MALFVQKFGGSSLADLKCISRAADLICETYLQGHDVVVVVSAMAGETDRLESLAYSVTESPNLRELDVLLASGEQVSIALLSMVLLARGIKARSYLGHQLSIQTDSVYTKARIQGIDKKPLLSDLAERRIVIVAGFQGVNEIGCVTTLGRGGSDTTAVALASVLNATECQIYTDVAGVYTADPHLVSTARLLPFVSFEVMLELSSLGAKILQLRAVELASRYQVPVRVRSTFEPGAGTLISSEDKTSMEQPMISGIAFCRNETQLTISDVLDRPGMIGQLLAPLAQAGIEVDMMVQTQKSDEKIDLSFTVLQTQAEQAKQILLDLGQSLDVRIILLKKGVAKLSLVGLGIRSDTRVASKMFEVLGKMGANIQLISTSEVKVSVLLDEKYLEPSVKALHKAFALGVEPREEVRV